jgi:hypothetical protein
MKTEMEGIWYALTGGCWPGDAIDGLTKAMHPGDWSEVHI